MLDFNSTHFDLNRFLKQVHLKKQYLKKMQNKASMLHQTKEKSHKAANLVLFRTLARVKRDVFVMYIISISFSKKNTLLHVSDCLGNMKLFYSAGLLQQKGKGKIARSIILRKFYKVLVLQLKFLRKYPIAVHFNNVDSNMFWFLKKLRKKLFIITVKHFSLYSYNGCRKRKIRRKKFKSGSLKI